MGRVNVGRGRHPEIRAATRRGPSCPELDAGLQQGDVWTVCGDPTIGDARNAGVPKAVANGWRRRRRLGALRARVCTLLGACQDIADTDTAKLAPLATAGLFYRLSVSRGCALGVRAHALPSPSSTRPRWGA